MSEELKPCPFCGIVPRYDESDKEADAGGFVACDFCGALGPDEKEKLGSDLWNHRPIEDALRSAKSTLEEMHVRLVEETRQLRAENARLRKGLDMIDVIAHTKYVWPDFMKRGMEEVGRIARAALQPPEGVRVDDK